MLGTVLADVRARGLNAAWARRALPDGLGEAIGLFLILRVSLTMLAVMLSAMVELPSPCYQYGFDDWPTKPELAEHGAAFQTLGVWERWDACWYLRIAAHGYERGEPATAFFPAYPAATRIAGAALGGRMLLGASVVSALAYLAAITALYRLVQRDFNRDAARRTALYISIFPTAFFFLAPFTEALFLAGAVWAIYAARMRWWSVAALAGLLAGLTRIQGVILILPLAWEVNQAIRARWQSPDSTGARDSLLGAVGPLAAVAAPLVALGAFFRFSTWQAGLSPLQAQQQNWGSSWHAPWTVVREAWNWSFNRTDIPWRDLQAINAFNLFLLIGFAALLIAGARRLPLSYTLFAAPQLILIGSRLNPTPLTSTARYLLVLFPVFVVLALLGRQRWLDQGWVVLSLLFLGFFTTAFLRNTFIA